MDTSVHGMEAVVKLHAVHTTPTYTQPWQKSKQYTSTSTAFALPGRRLLTCAHCIDAQTQVKVQRLGSDTKYLATVLAIGYDCDIALLTVADDDFWDGLASITFGDLPSLQEEVTVVGYPLGGNTISVTKGVVSRIDVSSYTYADPVPLLRVQIDAAINPGNSGGPAFNAAHQCIGIAFEALVGAGSIGYIIPVPVISHFFADISQNSTYTGFPWIGAKFQSMESTHLRAVAGMDCNGASSQSGALLRQVHPCSPLAAVARPGDVLLELDGVTVGTNATVPFRTGQRLALDYLTTSKHLGETTEVLLLQGGRPVKHTLALEPRSFIVPNATRDTPPPYLIVGGLVFTPLTTAYLQEEYGKVSRAPVNLSAAVEAASMLPCGEQLVMLSQVLAAPLTVGYESFGNLIVHRFNGTRIRNMRHLAALLDACRDPFLEFELHTDWRLVLPTTEARQATAGILETHLIPNDRSADLRPEVLAKEPVEAGGCRRICLHCQGGGWPWAAPPVAGSGPRVAIDAVGVGEVAVAAGDGVAAGMEEGKAADTIAATPTTADAAAVGEGVAATAGGNNAAAVGADCSSSKPATAADADAAVAATAADGSAPAAAADDSRAAPAATEADAAKAANDTEPTVAGDAAASAASRGPETGADQQGAWDKGEGVDVGPVGGTGARDQDTCRGVGALGKGVMLVEGISVVAGAGGHAGGTCREEDRLKGGWKGVAATGGPWEACDQGPAGGAATPVVVSHRIDVVGSLDAAEGPKA